MLGQRTDEASLVSAPVNEPKQNASRKNDSSQLIESYVYNGLVCTGDSKHPTTIGPGESAKDAAPEPRSVLIDMV